ncbi:hypothetical protein BGZ72_006200 [Mortierella alpina]|nr:hypothetical protein BGZ72_006200 [Mortierella alpina]
MASSWWETPEIIALLDWLRYPRTQELLSNHRADPNNKANDIYRMMADYFNTDAKSQWSSSTAKQQFHYLRQRYQTAKKVKVYMCRRNIDAAVQREKMDEFFPYLFELKDVFDPRVTHSAAGAPPPLPSSRIHNVIPDDAPGEPSGVKGEAEVDQAVEGQGMTDILLSVERFYQGMIKQRSLDVEAMLKRRWQELLDEKEEFKAMKDEFKEEWAKLKSEQANLNAEKQAFEQERLRLKCVKTLTC